MELRDKISQHNQFTVFLHDFGRKTLKIMRMLKKEFNEKFETIWIKYGSDFSAEDLNKFYKVRWDQKENLFGGKSLNL